jgi:pimeloyl-ACP methyl ester carboxylesterase
MSVQACRGLSIGYSEYGDPQGLPVLYCHGTPGSGVECELADQSARRHGLRFIAPDRPGYGETTAAHTMGYAAWAQVVMQLLRHLGIERYAVLGISGGGPNALALAAADGERVVALSVVCPLGPTARPELAHAVHPFVQWLLQRALRTPHALDRLLLSPAAALGHALPRMAVASMRLYNGRADRPCLSHPAVAELLMKNMQRAFQQGSAGVARDLRMMISPWDFSLERIVLPVKLWHGTADELLLPEHSRWIASHLAHAEVQLVPGAGHFSLPFEHIETIIKNLAEHCAKA